ncbi:MAG: hypothetical protein WDO18_14050 [Acidobacteriota bacterium]
MRALFTLLVTGIAFGQFYPLESVHVRGNVAIPEDRIVSATGLKIGQSVSRASFTAARERLHETGGVRKRRVRVQTQRQEQRLRRDVPSH